jgi:hypothetical protein
MDRYHITKKGEEWRFEKEGSDRAIRKADTKAEVVKEMQNFMDDKTGSVKIHKENGLIQEERTYQRKDDPTKSKG